MIKYKFSLRFCSLLESSQTFEPQQRGMCDQQRLRPGCAYAQSNQCLCGSLEYALSVKPLTVHHLEFLNLKEGFIGSSESTLVKIPHCLKSHAAAQFLLQTFNFLNYIFCSVFSCM